MTSIIRHPGRATDKKELMPSQPPDARRQARVRTETWCQMARIWLEVAESEHREDLSLMFKGKPSLSPAGGGLVGEGICSGRQGWVFGTLGAGPEVAPRAPL